MDYGHKLTEKELEELEKRISKEYETAEKEVQDKLFDYLQNFQRKDADMQAQKEAGKITQTEYNNWRVNQMATGKRWENMRNSLAEDFHNANNIAKEMTKEHSYDIYALNHNYGTYEIEKGLGIDTSYTLYDRATVERLLRDNPQMLPPPGKKVSERIKAGLDVRWNNQQIQSVMMQGLLQGMSMPDLAKRLAETVGDKDKVGAMRNARTMTTGAQNAGRVDSYKRAVDMGIKTKERWIAVLDEKTRHSHRQLDGEMVEVGEKFSNGLRYPGEPGGAPEEVYNCRCRIVSAIEGTALAGNIEDFPRLSKIDNYEDWKKGKEQKEEKKQEEGQEESARQVVQGTDISETWERRPDEFKFAIEDVINAQGFDGLPKVVSADEFDKYVKESNFIAQRTYSAPDQEILKSYQEQLYNGKWYVDCSNGGAVHGKGMYCVGNIGTKVTEKMTDTMISYGGMTDNAIIETFTLDKTANIIKENEIEKLYTDLGNNLIKKSFDKYDYSDDEIRFIASYIGIGDAEYKVEYLENNKEHAREIMQNIYGNENLSENLSNVFNEFLNITNDNGVVASMFGYDAIKCVGTQDYYVVLNRTKCIFKGE